jgi:hypothetical protein
LCADGCRHRSEELMSLRYNESEHSLPATAASRESAALAQGRMVERLKR